MFTWLASYLNSPICSQLGGLLTGIMLRPPYDTSKKNMPNYSVFGDTSLFSKNNNKSEQTEEQKNTVLITGAGRGIGYALVERYLKEGWKVIACHHVSGQELGLKSLAQKLPGHLETHQLDVTNQSQIKNLSSILRNIKIDVLVSNAGKYGPTAPSGDPTFSKSQPLGKLLTFDKNKCLDVFATNVLGSLWVAEAFVEQVSASEKKTIVFISSRFGSMHEDVPRGHYIYSASKAALNKIMKDLSIELIGRGITTFSIHPGWVRTDMGEIHAPLSAEASAQGVYEFINSHTRETIGCFASIDMENKNHSTKVSYLGL